MPDLARADATGGAITVGWYVAPPGITLCGDLWHARRSSNAQLFEIFPMKNLDFTKWPSKKGKSAHQVLACGTSEMCFERTPANIVSHTFVTAVRLFYFHQIIDSQRKTVYHLG